MTLDLNRLRSLALKATPGPWHWGERGEQAFKLYGPKPDYKIVAYSEPFAIAESNRQFIAAASPTTVLALLDRIEALTKARDEACDIADEYSNAEDSLAAVAAGCRIAELRKAGS